MFRAAGPDCSEFICFILFCLGVTGRACFGLALLVCTSYWKARPGQEEMESFDFCWPWLSSAGREAAGDETGHTAEERNASGND